MMGKLDGKLKGAEAKVIELEERERRLKKEAEERLAMGASQRNDLSVQLKDLKDSWEAERAEKRRLEAELEKIKHDKLDVEAELRLLRENTALQVLKRSVSRRRTRSARR
jgi:uncharacterized coiled-coil DUF342 family protein